MDILKPELVWIGNICYRKLPIKGATTNENYEKEDAYPINPREFRKHQDDEDDDECYDLPVMHDENRFWITITVPGPLIGIVLGKQNRNRKMIESSTGTSIKFPSRAEMANQNKNSLSREEQSTDAIILGDKRSSVCKAYQRIDNIINSGRWRVADYTHFISIPINNESIRKGFLDFKQEVLLNCKSARGISEDLFQYPATLHLTIVMMTLFNDKEKEKAKAQLRSSKNDILKMLGGKKIRVQVKGIEYMNDDPADVDVLYGKIRETDDDNALKIIADLLVDAFVGLNFAQKDFESVKLHVTLMKSRTGDKQQRTSFDARPVLKKYSDYVFGEMTLNEIHISTRFTGNAQKYYTSTAVVTL